MKTWKIKNIHNEAVKIAVGTSSSSSKGIILQPGELCLCQPQTTASIDAQRRRGFIEINENYDNSEFNFNLGDTLSEAAFIKTSKMEEAEKNAIEYIQKKQL